MPIDDSTPSSDSAAPAASSGPQALARTSDSGAQIVWADPAEFPDYRLYYRRDTWAWVPTAGRFLPMLRRIPTRAKLETIRASQDGWAPIPVDVDTYVRRYEGRGKKSVFVPTHSIFSEVPGQGYHVRPDEAAYWAWVEKLASQCGWVPDPLLLDLQVLRETEALQLVPPAGKAAAETQLKEMKKAIAAIRKAAGK